MYDAALFISRFLHRMERARNTFWLKPHTPSVRVACPTVSGLFTAVPHHHTRTGNVYYAVWISFYVFLCNIWNLDAFCICTWKEKRCWRMTKVQCGAFLRWPILPHKWLATRNLYASTLWQHQRRCRHRRTASHASGGPTTWEKFDGKRTNLVSVRMLTAGNAAENDRR